MFNNINDIHMRMRRLNNINSRNDRKRGYYPFTSDIVNDILKVKKRRENCSPDVGPQQTILFQSSTKKRGYCKLSELNHCPNSGYDCP